MSLRFRNPLVARNANLTAPDPHRRLEVYDPEGFMNRLNRTFRRRLSDRVEALFQEACLADDLDTAEELLTVLVNMHERRSRKFGGERRINDEAVVKIREELAKRKAVKGQRAN
jgi:hypothetical protein